MVAHKSDDKPLKAVSSKAAPQRLFAHTSEVPMDRLTISEATKRLQSSGDTFIELFSHGSAVVEFYKPEGKDPQQPHSKDELYFVASGSGYFVNGDSRRKFETGEVLFVPAGVVHRFEDFTPDFATWIVIYGPEGGESS